MPYFYLTNLLLGSVINNLVLSYFTRFIWSNDDPLVFLFYTYLYLGCSHICICIFEETKCDKANIRTKVVDGLSSNFVCISVVFISISELYLYIYLYLSCICICICIFEERNCDAAKMRTKWLMVWVHTREAPNGLLVVGAD